MVGLPWLLMITQWVGAAVTAKTGKSPLATELDWVQGRGMGFSGWRSKLRSYPQEESYALPLSFCSRQNKTSWVPQLQTARRKASSHLKTTETMISVRRGPEDNVIPALSPRPPGCMNCTHLSPHTSMSSYGEEAEKGVNTQETGGFIQMKEWTPTEKGSLDGQAWPDSSKLDWTFNWFLSCTLLRYCLRAQEEAEMSCNQSKLNFHFIYKSNCHRNFATATLKRF